MISMRKIWPGFLLGLLAVLALIAPAVAADAPGETTIVLASTTSVDNSGLLGAILPEFTKATGVKVRVLALGTGQALDTARRGDADIVLVHDPEAEQRFLADGNGVNRRQIAWNDFILVGPGDDPAHVAGGHNVRTALVGIADAEAPFVSRGDNSGTNALELRLWKAAGIDPKTGAGHWYRDIGGGMGAALNASAAMPAYTLSDRGTWISFKNKGPLRVMIEGDPALINRYDVIELNPRTHPDAKLAPAHSLAMWLTAEPGQRAIGAYKLDGEELFHPSAADPK
jgi:tungstate transport system substrate-binding protein